MNDILEQERCQLDRLEITEKRIIELEEEIRVMKRRLLQIPTFIDTGSFLKEGG